MLNSILCVKNLHPRDLNIKFEEEGHKYTIFEENQNEENQKKYTSVTTWVHRHFPHFNADEIIKKMMSGKSWKKGHKYWGLTAEQIKDLWNSKRDNAAGAGTNMHFEIECFMNSKELLDYTHRELYQQYKETNKELTLEWQFFLKFVEDFPDLKPYRTEWTIYDEELKLAGSIDMVYENPDGTLSIYDWKRAIEINRFNSWDKYAITECVNHIPDSNYWHYAFQLNAYKTILERKYGKVVKDLYLVRLHPDCEDKTYELIKLPDLKKDINQLFELLKVN
jgi:ATP-dependent exoDNAse (exonuclease V) beta subunit